MTVKKPTKAAIEKALLPLVRRGRRECFQNKASPFYGVTWGTVGSCRVAVATDGRVAAYYLCDHHPEGLREEDLAPWRRVAELLRPAHFAAGAPDADVSAVGHRLGDMAVAWSVAAALDALIRTPGLARQSQGWLLRKQGASDSPSVIVGDSLDVALPDSNGDWAPRWLVIVAGTSRGLSEPFRLSNFYRVD